MKATLVSPSFSNLGFVRFGKGGMDSNWINLGLAYISSYEAFFLIINKIKSYMRKIKKCC